jgi:hypothetical protein
VKRKARFAKVGAQKFQQFSFTPERDLQVASTTAGPTDFGNFPACLPTWKMKRRERRAPS